MSDLTKRFSEDGKKALQFAMTQAAEWGHTYVGSEHLLTGILAVSAETGSAAAKLLREQGVTGEAIKKRILSIVGTGTRQPVTAEDLTPTCKRILSRASQAARGSKAAPVDPDRLLMALLKEECVGRRLAENCGADPSGILEILEELYGKGNAVPEPLRIEPVRAEPERPRHSTPLLDKNAVDLTEKAMRGGIDPVIGREAEEEQIIGILLRRTKNNPCLVGEAGVGTTAIVESVAARIAEGRVPDALLGKRIMSLELASVVAGTKYRGEFEEKIRGILNEVKEADDVILFIDEIHTVVGAGAAEGAIDASNILKPPLARGELRLIGATTQKEYKRCIEKDAALDRRFRKVTVPEPTPAECLPILKGLRPRYEAFHGVKLTTEALEAAVTLSDRYLGDRRNPDKAIDLMDEAAARKRMDGGQTVTAADIERALSDKVRFPKDGTSRADELEKVLRAHIFGQDNAVSSVVAGIRLSDSGLREENRPLRSFLFLGPSGVGKTETARLVAETLCGKEGYLRIDMTEYAEPHSISSLIGAPPGYEGSTDGGRLTEQVRRHPDSVLLFDEAEKAHPEVKALLLRLLDEGQLTDSSGLTVSFRDTVIILTANAGDARAGVGFATGNTEKENAKRRAAELFSKEFADRLDEIIPFFRLSEDALLCAARRNADELSSRLSAKGLSVRFDDAFLKEIVRLASSGAREVSRLLRKHAGALLSEKLASGELKKDGDASLSFENGGFSVRISLKTY